MFPFYIFSIVFSYLSSLAFPPLTAFANIRPQISISLSFSLSVSLSLFLSVCLSVCLSLSLSLSLFSTSQKYLPSHASFTHYSLICPARPSMLHKLLKSQSSILTSISPTWLISHSLLSFHNLGALLGLYS